MAAELPATVPDRRLSSDAPESVTFGPFQLFPRSRELRTAGGRVNLGGRALEMLIVLVERAGEVVSIDEIHARVWPGTVVAETNLRVTISALRKALGEGRGAQRFIVTVHGRGYSFVAPVAAAPRRAAAASSRRGDARRAMRRPDSRIG